LFLGLDHNVKNTEPSGCTPGGSLFLGHFVGRAEKRNSCAFGANSLFQLLLPAGRWISLCGAGCRMENFFIGG